MSTMSKLTCYDIDAGPFYLGDGLWECITDSEDRYYVEGSNEDDALQEFDAGNFKDPSQYGTLFPFFPDGTCYE